MAKANQSMFVRAAGRSACVVASICWLAVARAAAPDGNLGPRVAETCAACHRMDGHPDGIPPIEGLATGTLIGMMKFARSNARVDPIMHAVSLSLSDEELAAVALYLANVGRDIKPK